MVDGFKHRGCSRKGQPQSFLADEFQKEIILASNIELPELPAGVRYVYEPKSHELLVEHQRKK